jgi:predicted enzyme related to lactoylglutathione lyase
MSDVRHMNLNQVTVPAIEVTKSTAFYETLGLELIVNSPHYARFKCPEGDSTFSVHLAAEAPSPSVVVYFEVVDLDETVRKLQNKGMSFFQEPRDEPWLWREARISDPSGNIVCLYMGGVNRISPPWRVASQS